jgi:HK97 family phage major capsid protein
VSIQLAEDSKVDLGSLLFEKFSEAIMGGIDYAAFQGSGAQDAADGGQTGIFQDATITTVKAVAGGVSAQTLTRDDFDNVVAAVTSAALQREPRWWIHPSFLPLLAKVRAGAGGDSYSLRGPGHTNGRGWFLVDFPVEWTAQAPSINQPGAKIAAFGDGNAYGISLRQDMALEASRFTPSAFQNSQIQYIASCRAWCQTRNSAGLATLTLANS